MMLHEIRQYKTEAAEEQIWKLLNKHCKDALNHKLPIVRGMEGFPNENFGIIHGAAGGRKSRNTSNHYTVILDAVLPKEFPKRGKSIICSNWANRRHSKGYGRMHAIIPFDGVTIGICPDDDMFGTEIKLGNRVNAIHRWNTFYDDMALSDQSFPAFIKDFKRLLTQRDLWGIQDYPNLKDAIAEAYTKPFKVATTATPEIYNDGQPHEVWIGGKCIAVDLEFYRSLMRNAKGVRK